MNFKSTRLRSYVFTYKIYNNKGVKSGELHIKDYGFYSALNRCLTEARQQCELGDILTPTSLINENSGTALDPKYFKQ